MSELRDWLNRHKGIHLALPAAIILGFLCQWVFVPTGNDATRWQTFPTSVMVSLAAAASGAFLAFLFGVPRYVSARETSDSKSLVVRPNNNFQEVSDWLTKIIVGIGLVQSRRIIVRLSEMVSWISTDTKLAPGYITCVAVLYAVCGFMIGYVWTVQNYARREMEYLERQYRIANQTLVTEATSALDTPSTSRGDLEFWYKRLTAAVQERPWDGKLAVAKSRYEAEVCFDLDKAIATLEVYLENCVTSGERGSDYASGLFWLASYEVRKIEKSRQPGDREQDKYDSPLKKLEEAVPIRTDAKSWLKTDADFQALHRMPRFEALFD